MQPLKIQLFPKSDTDDQVFYIGKLCFPGTISLGKGVSFYIYINDNVKELHICPTRSLVDDPTTYNTRSRKKTSRSKHNNIAIDLATEYDTDENSYFVGSIASNLSVSASEGIVFLVFVADVGEEELQISVASKSKNNKRFEKKTQRG
jgi:hypothetical protein